MPGSRQLRQHVRRNTMSAAIETMGLSLPYSSTMAAEDEEKADLCSPLRGGARGGGESNIRPLDLLTESLWRHQRDHGGGRSTNGAHLLPAQPASPSASATSTDPSAGAVICDLKPSGRYVTVDLHNAGGIPR